MAPRAMAKAKEPTDAERLTGLLEEKRQLRLRLAEVESDLESLLVRRSAVMGNPGASASPSPAAAPRKLAYRTKEVAEMLSVSEMTVVRAIERGDLRAVRLDPAASTGVRLVRNEDLEAWLESMR